MGSALDRREDLLTYRYIEKLSPNIKAMLLPSETPLILPVPQLGADTAPADKVDREGEPDPKSPDALTAPASSGPPASTSENRPDGPYRYPYSTE